MEARHNHAGGASPNTGHMCRKHVVLFRRALCYGPAHGHLWDTHSCQEEVGGTAQSSCQKGISPHPLCKINPSHKQVNSNLQLNNKNTSNLTKNWEDWNRYFTKDNQPTTITDSPHRSPGKMRFKMRYHFTSTEVAVKTYSKWRCGESKGLVWWLN